MREHERPESENVICLWRRGSWGGDGHYFIDAYEWRFDRRVAALSNVDRHLLGATGEYKTGVVFTFASTCLLRRGSAGAADKSHVINRPDIAAHFS